VSLPALTAAYSCSFVLRGLGQLADHTFIQAARNIKVVNVAGVKKIKRDVLALQQSLRGMFSGDEGVLSRSAAYWDMYDRGPKVSGPSGVAIVTDRIGHA
jgi:exocyst complex component 4